MTNAVAISCVIPTHNRPDLLREAIASVLRQGTQRSLELIVTDDEASPRTEGVVRDAALHAQMPVRYLPRSGPKGASASRNFAASVARGEILAFLDDDDLWQEDFVERAAEAIDSSGDDMAISWLSVLDLDGVVGPLFKISPQLKPVEVAAWNVGFTGSNFLIKKSAFDALGGFDSGLQVSNDKDFFLRFLLDHYQYAVVPEYLVIHRRHSGPQLTTGNERRAAGVEAYLLKHQSVLSWGGRRHLRKRIHRIRLRTSQSRARRFLHILGFVANLSPADVRSKWRRRDGKYSAVRT